MIGLPLRLLGPRGLRSGHRAHRRAARSRWSPARRSASAARRATGCAPWSRCRSSARSTSSPSTRSSSPPIASAGTSSPIGLLHAARAARDDGSSAPTRWRRSCASSLPGAPSRDRHPRLSHAPPRRAGAVWAGCRRGARRRRVQRGGGLRDSRSASARRRGGAAVVLGALSPRTRNAQVALYQARRGAVPRGHRRHRHGAQPRRRPRRVRVGCRSSTGASTGRFRRRRARADRRAGGPPPARRELRHAQPAAACPGRGSRRRGRGASLPRRSSGWSGATGSSTSARSTALLGSLAALPPSTRSSRVEQADDFDALRGPWPSDPRSRERPAGEERRAARVGGLPDPRLPQAPLAPARLAARGDRRRARSHGGGSTTTGWTRTCAGSIGSTERSTR